MPKNDFNITKLSTRSAYLGEGNVIASEPNLGGMITSYSENYCYYRLDRNFRDIFDNFSSLSLLGDKEIDISSNGTLIKSNQCLRFPVTQWNENSLFGLDSKKYWEYYIKLTDFVLPIQHDAYLFFVGDISHHLYLKINQQGQLTLGKVADYQEKSISAPPIFSLSSRDEVSIKLQHNWIDVDNCGVLTFELQILRDGTTLKWSENLWLSDS